MVRYFGFNALQAMKKANYKRAFSQIKILLPLFVFSRSSGLNSFAKVNFDSASLVNSDTRQHFSRLFSFISVIKYIFYFLLLLFLSFFLFIVVREIFIFNFRYLPCQFYLLHCQFHRFALFGINCHALNQSELKF